MPMCKNYRRYLRSSQVFLILLAVTLVWFSTPLSIYAEDDCSRYAKDEKRLECEINKLEDKYESESKKLSEIRADMEELSQKISNLSSQLNITQAEINELQASINQLEERLAVINDNLTQKNLSLTEKIDLRNKVVRNYYQEGVLNGLEMFLTTVGGFRVSSLSYIFEKTLAVQAIETIGVLTSEIKSFEADKAEAVSLKEDLEKEQANLLAVKNQLAEQKGTAEEVHSELEEEETEKEERLLSLDEKIDELTAKQQEILREKYGDSYGTVGDYEAPSYKLPDPPYKPAFAAMSYGAFTHYNGMSQYGAKGRAEDGDDYKDILEFYYETGVEEKDGFPDKISVQGYGDLDYQYYLYGIAEMPSSWPKEALKAQAIAARTYAYRSGKPICTTQSCQVFLKSKADDPPDRWKDAVDDTKDEILKDPGTSQYSSTTGGYINNIGWDLDGDKWPQDAYEKEAGSPWFYKAWYTQSYTDSSSKCGRSTPWLTEDEMVDILNAWVVWDKGDSDDRDHISPVTTSCWGGDPYSHSKMADKADDHGDDYKDISSISVEISNGGYTSKITFDTDKGDVSIGGKEFRTVFNLRAPAYVALRSRLYDFELEK